MARLYLAGPLFSESELEFNRAIRDLLNEYFEIYLPQEDGGLMVQMRERGVSLRNARSLVFSYDLDAIKEADYLLIILDGRTVDEGASFELGFAYALGKTCVGYQNDPRRLLPDGNNPMIQCALERIFNSKSQLLEWAVRQSGVRERRSVQISLT